VVELHSACVPTRPGALPPPLELTASYSAREASLPSPPLPSAAIKSDFLKILLTNRLSKRLFSHHNCPLTLFILRIIMPTVMENGSSQAVGAASPLSRGPVVLYPWAWGCGLFRCGALEVPSFFYFFFSWKWTVHEVHGHSPVFKIDFGLLTLICRRRALQRSVMPPSVSTLGRPGFESRPSVFNGCCVWAQRTRGLPAQTLLGPAAHKSSFPSWI